MAKKSLLKSAEAARGNGARNAIYSRRQANRISLWIVIAVAAILGVYVGVELATDPASVSGGELRVRALFGYSLELSEIREASFEETPIATGRRVFGNDAFGLFREGNYEVDGLGLTRVFLKTPNVSYITVKTDDKSYAISLGSRDKDQLLYNAIKLGMR
jgi:hypothetical protein